MPTVWISIVAGILAAMVIFQMFIARPLVNYFLRREVSEAKTSFKRRREMLEAKFFELASRQGKPRGLVWKECDWQEPVTFARDLESGLLTAFVGVEIHFEAVEGSDMEDVEAVSTIRDAAAVFHYRAGQWGTGGKALFNMNPADAITRLEGQFEAVG
jgi:hypothetical protein